MALHVVGGDDVRGMPLQEVDEHVRNSARPLVLHLYSDHSTDREEFTGPPVGKASPPRFITPQAPDQESADIYAIIEYIEQCRVYCD